MNTYFKSRPLILILIIAILSSTFLVSHTAQAAYDGTALAPGVAGSGTSPLAILGAPPNDNFASATIISGLPYSDLVDITQATIEPDQPQYCYSQNTVWYSFTPSADGAVRVDTAGSSFWDTNITIYQAKDPGITGLVYLECSPWGQSATFNVQAGVTYYLLVGSMWSTGGILQLKVEQIPPPANDDFANATVIPGIPFDDTVDTMGATIQPGEPTPTCAFSGILKSVWYAFTPATSGSFSVSIPWAYFNPLIAVYTGASLDGLSELKCQSWSGLLTIQADAGTTYYFQVGSIYFWQDGGPMQFHLDVPPPPYVGFFLQPWDPSTFDVIRFYDTSFDPGQIGFQSFTWDFGDGTTSTDPYASHKYSADGDYTVQHSATTYDGRTASAIQVVKVQTHDVGISKISAPLAASVGQTRPIVVSIRNTRYAETVRVDLYKSAPGSWDGYQLVSSLTQVVPARQANRPTFFAFQYKFTNDDASSGKVTFKAVATIEYTRDALTADNQAFSIPSTKVNKSK